MQKQNHAFDLDKFKEVCREHHLKITPQRVAIYRELVKSDTHPTTDKIYQIVKKEYPHISFDTVNRTLLTYAETGIVDVVEIFGGAKRFDPNIKNHHHLHCTKCGKVFDFYSRAFDNLELSDELQREFLVTGKRVVLKGFCKECQP